MHKNGSFAGGRARWRVAPGAFGSASGFTLIELLVAMAVFAILSIGLYNLLFEQTRFFGTEEALNATQQNTRTALRRVADDLLLVGRGVNTLSLDNPDVIVPNDGTVTPNTLQKDAVTLLSTSDSVPQVPFAATAPRGSKSVTVADDIKGVARGLLAGVMILVHDTNLNNSQVLKVTKATDQGSTVKIDFATADSLLVGYPVSTSRMYPLDVVSYRVNRATPSRPHLERRLNVGPWEKMMAGIDSLAFTYFDRDGNELTPNTQTLRRQIRSVRIEVDGRSVRPVDRRGKHVTLRMSTLITPRNMME
jgi:prepilin-type N-terminal cleavage/methylation domain-containing protein